MYFYTTQNTFLYIFSEIVAESGSRKIFKYIQESRKLFPQIRKDLIKKSVYSKVHCTLRFSKIIYIYIFIIKSYSTIYAV